LVKVNLEIFLPALVELVDFRDFPWDKIDQAFTAKWQERTIASKGEPMIVEASIYDVIIGAKKGKREAIGLLDFFNKLFEELVDNLTPPEKVLVRSSVKSMLKALDSKYLNFVGEIGVLNNMIKSGGYRLNAIEQILQNGKSVDFKFTKTINGEIIMVEVVNIHLDADRVENNITAIDKFLTNKLAVKMADKKQNLTINEDIHLVPVLWGGWENIRIYSNYFRNNKLSLSFAVEPIAYLQYNNRENYFEHHFKTVSHLFDKD